MLAIWQTEETVDELCQMLGLNKTELPAWTESRLKEWLAIRILLKHILKSEAIPILEYDDNGKPHLSQSAKSISISHTKNFVGVMISSQASCGIDLEIVS
jgi:phosphopantetheinyl transferase